MAFEGTYVKDVLDLNINELYEEKLSSAYYRLANIMFLDNNNKSEYIDENSDYDCTMVVEVYVYESESDRRNNIDIKEAMPLIITCNKEDSFSPLWKLFYDLIKPAIINEIKRRLLLNEDFSDLPSEYKISLESV